MFSLVFMAALLGVPLSVPAHKVVAASSAPPVIAGLVGQPGLEHLGTEKVVRSNTVLTPQKNAASNQMIPSAYRDVDRMAPSAAPGATAIAPGNSGWRYTAALLGTLGIIGTIAVRRRKPGKPWA
jgi:hypothetical protein